MKSLFTLAGFSFLFMIGTQSEAASLRNRALKKLICESAVADYSSYGLTKAKCDRATFEITDATSDTVGGRSQTTLMQITVKTTELTLNVTVKKIVAIDDAGRIVLKPTWSISNITESLTDAVQIILRANISSPNVKKLRSFSTLPDSVTGWNYSCELADYKCEGYKYYKILHPETEEIVGYIVEEAAASSEADLRVLNTLRFDLEGNPIGEIQEESWGYNE